MTAAPNTPSQTTGFHEGELAVQTRAGLRDAASRLEGMLAPVSLTGGRAAILGLQSFAVLVARDEQHRLWASPLVAQPGFLAGHGQLLLVKTKPAPADALHNLAPDQAAGVLAIDLERRRRVRVNGWITDVAENGLTLDVHEAFGNCPSYVQPRQITQGPSRPVSPTHSALAAGGGLTDEARRIITTADMFFLGTEHPTRGADASHKGGSPGFVQVDGADVIWPDYAGNNMFNSMGNLNIDPTAALLFIDFESGDVLQLTGRATLEWNSNNAAGNDFATGRSVRFHATAGALWASAITQQTA
ncbi:pyridoxamine 5'-phosphate oxidase [Kribbella capetownensis]|uniref:Pyridoxamine 5'-phosphate oxidase n=1 Tax=Kribbella capetownensis TaxID=1572659 RepID=A0A4R0JFU4_9ACTN|nr:pyridoxamine 5'-phosphate oxidase family protein [Kribbella capetownensis]TCC45027.1 pyridoxamine 5'-phosphate oxidase [Kribbella capetownensis]